ncbi:RHS repeat-associated core domain-containing protein, partial [Patescibacteria group bacterium]|nr:RHS repeat-associated core domain-containing protein [Patescibacteria group bacterium]
QGNVVERRDYLPYGSQRVAETFNGVPITELGFTGKHLDSETGLNYYGARYYDPVTGRFITMDPLLLNLDKMSQAQRNAFLSNPQNLNMYSYAYNNPTRFVDANGEAGEDFHFLGTEYFGVIAGLDTLDAFEIAYHDYGVDLNPKTNPYASEQIRAEYHFPSEARVSEAMTAAFESLDNADMGVALHVSDDYFTQGDYGPEYGHAADLWTTDWSWWSDLNTAQFKTAAYSSFLNLREFNKIKNGTNGLTDEEYDQRSQEIFKENERKIDNYLNAKTYEDKYEALYSDEAEE